MNKEGGLTMPDSFSWAFSLNRELSHFGKHLIDRLWIKKKKDKLCQCQSHGCERGKKSLLYVICISLFDLYWFGSFAYIEFTNCFYFCSCQNMYFYYLRKFIIRTT